MKTMWEKGCLGVVALAALTAAGCVDPILEYGQWPAHGGSVAIAGPGCEDIGEITWGADGGFSLKCEMHSEEIPLEATPAEGWELAQWRGTAAGCEGSAPRITIRPDGDDETCIANFVEVSTYPFKIIVSPHEGGTVGVDDASCSTECDFRARYDRTVKLTSKPRPGYVFSHWQSNWALGGIEGCDTESPDTEIRVVIGGGECTAVFEPALAGYNILDALKLSSEDYEQAQELYKDVEDQLCTPLSDCSECRAPEAAQSLVKVLDPLLQMSPAATDRVMSRVFPCGQGETGFTVCSTGYAPPGDWIWLQTTFAAPIPLEDATGIYQLAWVFDADGDPANDYQASAEYPMDFFDGSDKWYELLYEPGDGWSVRVRDVRQGFADVPTNARFVIAGAELAIFIPRAELDGAAPTFRTTAFRHEGDYGMNGGPWSGDYWPRFEEAYAPVALDEVFVVPE